MLTSFGSASKLFERSNNQTNCNDHFTQSIPKSVVWGTRLRDLINRYINHEIGICIHLRFHRGRVSAKLEGRDFVMIFKKTVTSNSEPFHGNPVRDFQLGHGLGNPRSDNMELPVPVLSGPISENPNVPIKVENQKPGIIQFGSVVRLYRFDESLTLIREWPDTPSCLVEIPVSGANRKLQSVLIGGRVLSALNDGGRIDTTVQSGSKVIEGFSKFERAGGRQIVATPDTDTPRPVALHVYGSLIEAFRFDDAFPEGPQCFAVGLCPFNSLPAPMEFGVAHSRYTTW
jgi:hypothetical protein